MPKKTISHSLNVFINCPFDPGYSKLFNAIVFAVQLSGFVPRCSKEADNAGSTRLHKIQDIVAECKYSIHDLSRTEPGLYNLPRFNMPLELGIDLGAKRYGSHRQKHKSLLILDKRPYRYQRFISDINGQDIWGHSDRPKQAILRVRNWLSTETGSATIPGGEYIHRRYLAFKRDLPKLCEPFRFDVNDLTFGNYTHLVRIWLEENES